MTGQLSQIINMILSYNSNSYNDNYDLNSNYQYCNKIDFVRDFVDEK